MNKLWTRNYHFPQKYIYFINVWLTLATIFTYIYSENSLHLLSWAFIGLSLYVLFRFFVSKEYYIQQISTVVMTSYLVLSLAGIVSVLFYDMAYRLPFAPYHDDSYYFNNILTIASMKMPDEFTLYEVCMAPVCWLFSVVDLPVNVQDLLPVNWALGAVAVGLATFLATKVSRRFSLLVPVALLFNFNFVDTTVHLYRDGLLLVLTLLCILCAMRKRYLAAVGFAFLVGLTRGGNGFLCFMYILIIFLCNIGWISKLNTKSVIVCLGVVIAFISVDSIVKMGSLGRSFTNDSADQGQSIMERASERSNIMLGGESRGFDSTKLLYSMGPLGMAAIPISNIFSPIRWSGLGTYTGVYNVGKRYVVRPVLFFGLITVVLWPIIGPRLVQGLRLGVKGCGNEFALSLMFIVTVLAISLISFQARHRTAFEIFFPCFVAMAVFETYKDRKLRLGLVLFFIALILVTNILPYLL